MPPGALSCAEPLADQRNRPARIGQLPPHQHHQGEAEQQEQQAGDGVLDADHLVIEREHVLPPEPELLVLCVVRVVHVPGAVVAVRCPTSDSLSCLRYQAARNCMQKRTSGASCAAAA